MNGIGNPKYVYYIHWPVAYSSANWLRTRCVLQNEAIVTKRIQDTKALGKVLCKQAEAAVPSGSCL